MKKAEIKSFEFIFYLLNRAFFSLCISPPDDRIDISCKFEFSWQLQINGQPNLHLYLGLTDDKRSDDHIALSKQFVSTVYEKSSKSL